MAEDQENTGQELSSDEAAELERLLEEPSANEEGSPKGLKEKLKKILYNRKLLLIFGGGVLFLILAIGAGVYFLFFDKETEMVPVEEQAIEEEIEEDINEVIIEKVNMYQLDPFFLPIRDNGKETGQFISVEANLLLSNSGLNKEIDKVLPLMRKNIYNILKRKKPSDFSLKRARTEERIKIEIMNASNAIILSGKGTITDVFFSQYMVK